MKVVYLWKNGQAIIVHKNEEDEYVYPDEKWTENQPPQGIILPCYYDGKQWVGQTQDELEKMLPEVEIPVDDKDIAIAKLTSLVVDLQEEVMSLKQNIALIDLYKKKLYTDETFKKFVRVGWITPEQFKETTGKDYEPQVK